MEHYEESKLIGHGGKVNGEKSTPTKTKALEKKKGGKESYSDLLKRTKGMSWFEAGQEHMKYMGHKQKDLQTKEQYKKMIDNAKAYD